MDLYDIVLIAALIFAVVILIKFLTKPIRFIFKLLINALCGFVGLMIVNFFGDIIGISVAVTFVNALFVGIFGIPGLIVLLLL